MSRAIMQTSLSLDVYIAGPNDSPGPLHEWMFSGGGGGPGEGLTGADKETIRVPLDGHPSCYGRSLRVDGPETE